MIKKRHAEHIQNARYLKISKRLATLKYALVSLLIIVSVLSLLFFGNEFNAKNLHTLFNTPRIELRTDASKYDGLGYDKALSFGLLYCRCAVLDEYEMKMYGKNGWLCFDDLHTFSSPRLAVSDTRAVVYDTHGAGFRIYDKNSLLHFEKSDHPISLVAICENGYIATVSSGDAFRSIIKVYNGNFECIYTRRSSDKDVAAMKLCEDGTLYAVYRKHSDGVSTVVARHDIFTDKATESAVYDAECTDVAGDLDGSFCLIFDKRLAFFRNGNEKSVLECTASLYSVSKEYYYFLVHDELILTDTSGCILSIAKAPENVYGIYVSEQYAYAISSEKISRCTLDTGDISEYHINENIKHTVECDNGDLLIFTETGTALIKNKEFN